MTEYIPPPWAGQAAEQRRGPMRWSARCCILAILSALASVAIAGDADDEEMKKLEGTWKFVSLESDGEQAPGNVIATWRWVVRGNEITWRDPTEDETKTSFKVDTSKSPKSIDLTAVDGKEKGKMFKCIYLLEGERLKICVPEGRRASVNPARPEEFSGGKGMSLMVLERIKDE
jgi:uncharacterized protein (TIGR03067 family)